MDNKFMLLILAMIGIIVGVIFMPVIANQISLSTNTITYTNQDVVSAATVNGNVKLSGQNFQGTPAIVNASGDDVKAQFTISQKIDSSNLPYVNMLTKSTAITAGNNGTHLNVTYVSEPVGYADGATRGILPIILLLIALGIALIGLRPVARNFF